MKQYIIYNKAMECEICKVNYSVGRPSKDTVKKILRRSAARILERTVIWMVCTAIIAGVMYFLSRFRNMTTGPSAWKIALFALFGTAFGLMFVYILYVIRNGIRMIKFRNFEVFCNQTEIAYHNPNSKEILKEFIENIESPESEQSERLPTNDDKEDIKVRNQEMMYLTRMRKKYDGQLQRRNVDISLKEDLGDQERMKHENKNSLLVNQKKELEQDEDHGKEGNSYRNE